MPRFLNNPRARGHSLLEVLAALALASVGVLGFLQTQHLRETTETTLLARIYAVMLARDVARKISANPAALSGYRSAYDAPPALTADCRRHPCSRNELAAFHLAQWKCRLGRWVRHANCRSVLKSRGLLHGGDGRIRLYNNVADITVRWLDAGREPQSFNLRHALLDD